MAGPFVVGRNRAHIDAPAKRIFEYLSDLSRYGEWIGEQGFRVTASPVGPPAQGSQVRREMNGVMRGPLIIRGGMADNPVRVTKATTITVFEPDTALVVETRNSYNGLLHSIEKFTFDLQPEALGTAVTMVSEVEPMVPSAYIGPVYAIRAVRGLFARLFGNRLTGLVPQASVGPHLSRIKQATEAAQIPGDA